MATGGQRSKTRQLDPHAWLSYHDMSQSDNALGQGFSDGRHAAAVLRSANAKTNVSHNADTRLRQNTMRYGMARPSLPPRVCPLH